MPNTLTQEYLKSILIYNPKTGDFTQRISRVGSRKKGASAGYKDPNGYTGIGISGKQYRAHRLAFLYMEGVFPPHDVDHINHDSSDNRWENLRKCTRSQNLMNIGVRKTNTSGYKGVCWDKSTKRFLSTIGRDGIIYNIGRFTCKKDAARAYNKKALELHGEFAYQNKIGERND